MGDDQQMIAMAATKEDSPPQDSPLSASLKRKLLEMDHNTTKITKYENNDNSTKPHYAKMNGSSSSVDHNEHTNNEEMTPLDETNKERSEERDVTCSKCNSAFETVEVYLEHQCPVSQAEDGSASMYSEEESEGSDMESFQGEIIYQPDGSAYLVDNSNLPKNAGNQLKLLQNAVEMAQNSSSMNRLVNALHIPTFMTARNLDHLSMALNGPCGTPVVHSFRVYDVRNKSSGQLSEGAIVNDDKKGSEINCSEESKKMSEKHRHEFSGKPILMCFLCKLSFGFSKSFRAHASQEHRIKFSAQEDKLMAQKGQCAIIQGVEDAPLLSFLELTTSKAQNADHNGSFVPPFISSATSSVGFVYPVSIAISTTNAPHVITSTTATSNAAQSIPLPPATISQSYKESPLTANFEQKRENFKQNTLKEETKEEREGFPRGEGENEQFYQGMDENESQGHSKPAKQDPTSNSAEKIASIDQLSTADENSNFGIMSNPCSTDGADMIRVNGEQSLPAKEDGVEGDMDENSHFSASQDSDHFQEMIDFAHLEHTAGCSGDKSSNVECPKCDAVLSSSRSLGGHMTMMHSRNSCKTLKCPKCNWHYKYQQTLEAHMKEKHPEDETKCVYCDTNQAHPRLSRGESYTCGYKPYRCGICNYSTTTKGNLSIHMQSDKHLNNVQELQSGGEHKYLQAKLGDLAAITKPKQKQTWRCEACDYETSVARNLNIHMTSQKHIQNMMTIHQNVSQMQRELQANLANISPDESLYVAMTQNMIPMMSAEMGGQSPSASDIQQLLANYKYDPITYGAMMNQLALGGVNPMDIMEENIPVEDDPSKDEPLKLFHCAVCNRFSTDSFEALFHHVQKDRSEPNSHLWKVVLGDTQQCTLCNYSTQVKANFQLHLKTDKHNQKLNLFNHIREGGKHNEWRLKYMNVGNPVQVRCNACDFYTHSVDKLCSHCHPNNFRHETSMKLFRHLQKINITYNVLSRNFRCSLCNFSTRAKLTLVQHVQSQQHIQNESKCVMKEQPSRPNSEASSSAAEPAEAALDLSKKEPAVTAVKPSAEMTNQSQSPEMTQSNGNLQLLQMFPQLAMDPNLSGTPQIFNCPYCKYSSVDHQHIAEHVISQHSLKPHPQPVLRCPLCQDICTNRINLEVHLMEVHSVSRECMQRLMMTVDAADWTPSQHPSSVPTASTSSNPDKSSPKESAEAPKASPPPAPAEKKEVAESKGTIPPEVEPDCIDLAKEGPFLEADNTDLYRCQKCHNKFANLDQLYSHQEKICPLTEQDTPSGPGFLCWKRGCNQYFKTPQGLQTHFREIHAKAKVLTYNIQAYKFKCSQCSLAFKTRDRLMEHDRTHSMIKCIACQKLFPSPSVLRIHIETAHAELSKADQLKFYNTIPRVREALGAPRDQELALPANPIHEHLEVKSKIGAIKPSGESSLEQPEAETPEEPAVEEVIPDEESYNDPANKYKCHRCIIGFAKQSDLIRHGRSLQHKNEQNYLMDRYFDPKRPHKCDLCRESFTQKSILLSHLNSVSHLHKLKQSLNEPGDPDAVYLPGESKPYRCKLCKVSYSTHTTLDTHFRSVIHQSRASKRGKMVSEQSTSSSIKEEVVEKKESTSVEEQKSLSAEETHQKHFQAQLQAQQAQLQAQQAHYQQLQMQQLAQMQQYQQAYLQQTIAAHLSGNPNQALDPTLMSPELAMIAMAASFPPGFYPTQMPMVPFACNLCAAPFATQEELALHQAQVHSIKPSTPDIPSLSHKPSEIPAAQEHPPAADSKCSTTEPPLKRKRSSAIQRKLLASYGFDLVQQFNEYAQGLPQSIAAEDKFRCKDCSKEFSSIWVFKAHVEEVHKQVLEIKKIEQYAQVFRDELLEENEEAEQEEKDADRSRDTERVKTESVPLRPKSRDSAHFEEPKQPSPALTSHSGTPDEEVASFASKLTQEQMMPPPPTPPTSQMLLPNAYQLAMMQAMQPVTAIQPYHVMQPQMHQLQQAATNLQGTQQLPFLDPKAAPPRNNNTRRGRTRISEDQLKVLKAYFNISNSPTDEQIIEMSLKTGLPHKVIKHWFRNTLFKERQRNKDSPYNFNNPPTTTLLDAEKFCKDEKETKMSSGDLKSQTPVQHESKESSDSGLHVKKEKVEERPRNEQKKKRLDDIASALSGAKVNSKETDLLKEKNTIPSNSTFPDSPHEYHHPTGPHDVREDPDLEKTSDTLTFNKPLVEKQDSCLPVEETPKSSSFIPNGEGDRETTAGNAYTFMDDNMNTGLKVEKIENKIIEEKTDAYSISNENVDSLYKKKMPYEIELRKVAKSVETEERGSVEASIQNDKTTPEIPKQEHVDVKESTHNLLFQKAGDFMRSQNVEKAEDRAETERSLSKPNEADLSTYEMFAQRFRQENSERSQRLAEELKAERFGLRDYYKDDDSYEKVNESLEKKKMDPMKAIKALGQPPSNTPTSSLSELASPLSSPVSPAAMSRLPISPPTTSSSPSSSSSTPSSRRSGRTRFTDYQIKVLQEFFESNAYPRDEDVEHLSRLLNLNGRVIVVWFQNARQKARKIFENQPPPDMSVDPGDEFHHRDSCMSYPCNRCGIIFQRFHDLIKHQKHLCTGASGSAAKLLMSAAGPSSHSPLGSSSGKSTPQDPEKKPAPEKHCKEREREKDREKEEVAVKKESKTFHCDKCNIGFNNADQWQEHQQIHMMNMGLFGSYFPSQQMPYNMMYMPYEGMNGLTTEKYLNFINSQAPTTMEESPKRKYSETSDSSDRGNESDHHRDKRLRTTITPAQLDILYSKYQEDSNPTRRMLDMIAHEVGLKKRVVQVWFQNTRARERKGQFRIAALQQARKCPFCDEMFKSKNAMETHARMRHFDQYSSKEQLEELIGHPDPNLLSPGERAASVNSHYSMDDGNDAYLNRHKQKEDYAASDDSSQDGRQDRGHDSSRKSEKRSVEEDIDKDPMDEFDYLNSEVSYDENSSECTSREADILSPTSSMVGDDFFDKAPSEAGSLDPSEDSYSNCDESERHRFKDGARRYRTQMSQVQLKVLKHCFADYRTPIMQECELLGQEIGLPRRVVQIWFQNARAKEKKVKANVTKQFGLIGSSSEGRPESCKLCGVKYSGVMSVRDHIFTEQHVRNVKKKVLMEVDRNEAGTSSPMNIKHESSSTPDQLSRTTNISQPSSSATSAGVMPTSSALSMSPLSSAVQMQAFQAMQAQMLPTYPPGIPFPGPPPQDVKKEDRKEKVRENSKSHEESSKNEKAKSIDERKHMMADFPMPPNMAAGDAALMSYFYGGLAPYYAQMPMMYPVYPMGAEMFYAQDPAMQAAAAFSPHMLQAYAANPLAAQHFQQQMQEHMEAMTGKSSKSEPSHKKRGSTGSSSSAPSEKKSSSSSSASSSFATSSSGAKQMEVILKPNSSTNRYLCKRCERVYTDLESVKSHQVTSCFLGQVLKIEETVEKLPSNRYLCQICPRDTLITEEDVLKHLHSFSHQQRAFLMQYESVSRAEVKKEK